MISTEGSLSPLATFLTGPIRWVRFQQAADVVVVSGRSCVLGSLRAQATEEEAQALSSPPADVRAKVEIMSQAQMNPSEQRLRWRLRFRGRSTVPLTALCDSMPLVGTADGHVLRIDAAEEDIEGVDAPPQSSKNRFVTLMKPCQTAIVGLSPHAAATDGGLLFSMDLQTGQWSLHAMTGTGFTAFASRESALEIVTATRSGCVHHWDLREPMNCRLKDLAISGRSMVSKEAFPHPKGAIPLCLDVDDHRVVAGTDTGDILEWDRRQATKLLRADHLHEGVVCDVRCLHSTDGYPQIASCGTDGRVYFASAENALGPVTRGGPGADFATSLDINPVERLVGFGGDAGLLHVYAL